MKTETIEEKTYRIMVDLHKFTGPVPTLEESLKDSIFLTVRDALELALAEEREACVNAPTRTLMQTANMLPHGWTMQIDLQKGSGGVSLFGPFDDLYEPDTGNGIEANMAQAVQFANFRNAEQETAVNGAWSRFVAAMGNDMPDSPKAEVSE